MSLRQKRAIVEAELQHVFSYPRWEEVLKVFDLQPATSDFSPLVISASKEYGGGEGEAHKALKAYIARNPEAIDLKANFQAGVTEYPLPSGDSLDVSLKGKVVWVAVEVKSAISNEADIARGLFQGYPAHNILGNCLYPPSEHKSAS